LAKFTRLKYTYGGKDKRLSLGVYPEVSLADARDLKDRARALLKDGKDPATERRLIQTKLKDLKLFTGYSAYLFPNHGKHPFMSENTLNRALWLMGYKGRVVAHGFRATASTILNESGQFSPDAIERQLAHQESNKVRAVYHRAEYLPERRRMM
jgi:integrase